LKLAVPDLEKPIKAYLAITSGPTNDGAPFNLSAGAGFDSKLENSNAPPFRLELTFAPVAFIDLLSRMGLESRFDGPSLVCSNGSQRWVIDENTGRLFASGTNGAGVAYRLAFEKGAYQRALLQLEKETTSHPNAYKTNAPLTSMAGFFLEAIAFSEFIRYSFFSRF